MAILKHIHIVHLVWLVVRGRMRRAVRRGLVRRVVALPLGQTIRKLTHCIPDTNRPTLRGVAHHLLGNVVRQKVAEDIFRALLLWQTRRKLTCCICGTILSTSGGGQYHLLSDMSGQKVAEDRFRALPLILANAQLHPLVPVFTVWGLGFGV